MRVPFIDLRRGYDEARLEIDSAVRRVLGSGVYILGPELEAFEREFAEYHGSRHAVGVASGADALYLILRALDIGPGDEVIVPGFCFVALWFAVSRTGARPVPIEPDETTLTLDPARIPNAVTAKTKAVIALHLFGQPADMTALVKTAKARGLKVIEDVSQAAGATHMGRRVGTWGDAAAFDFYPTLNLGALGDGGAILVNEGALAERLRSLRSFGAKGKYYSMEPGIGSRLGEIQAAVLRIRLRRLEEENRVRARHAGDYAAFLAKAGRLTLPSAAEGSGHVWHRYVVRHPHRDALARGLAAQGVQSLVHYAVAPHLTRAYQNLGYLPGSLPLTEKICSQVLSLPMGPHLTSDQVHHAAQLVERETQALAAVPPAPAAKGPNTPPFPLPAAEGEPPVPQQCEPDAPPWS